MVVDNPARAGRSRSQGPRPRRRSGPQRVPRGHVCGRRRSYL